MIAPSNNVGFHQLKHGGTMSDACPQALCLGELVEQKIRDAVRAQFTNAEWNAMSEAQREDELVLYSSTCHHHIRNVAVAHAEAAVDRFMVAKLEADLERIPFVKRITAKVRSCHARAMTMSARIVFVVFVSRACVRAVEILGSPPRARTRARRQRRKKRPVAIRALIVVTRA